MIGRLLQRWALAALTLAVLLFWAPHVGAKPPVPLTPAEAERKQALIALLRTEDDAVIEGNLGKLKEVFLPGSETAQAAARHARARAAFLAAWARTRHIRFHGIEVSIRTPLVRMPTPEVTRLVAIVSETLTYSRNADAAKHWCFGLGVHHQVVIERRGGRWFIRSDDFTDPLDQDTRVPGEALPIESPASSPQGLSGKAETSAPSLGAKAAVAYADRYCGAAPGCGNGSRYHPRYADFNGAGGDCTNFTSQVLQAGGFRQNAAWSFDTAKGTGTRAWLNAEGLLAYLTWTGRATVFARGTFRTVTRPEPGAPRGKVSGLRLGDLIGYFEKGHLVHFAVVTGFGPAAYPLVNSHTGDRYRVPWDIGWDQSTVFYLLHVHYAKRASGRS